MFPVVDDSAWPIFRAGEIVIIDPRQKDPIHGELFVIEYGRDSEHSRKCVVEAFGRVVNICVYDDPANRTLYIGRSQRCAGTRRPTIGRDRLRN